MLDVDVAVADEVEDAGDHARDVAVQHAEAAHAHAGERRVREVDRVFDVAVYQVIIELHRGHGGAAILALGGAGADVRQGDHVRGLEDDLVRKVGDVLPHPAAVEGAGHGLVVHHLGAGLVDDAHAHLHLGKGLVVEHVVGLLVVGDVDADVVGLLVNGLHILGPDDITGQAPGCVDRHEGIVAVDHHAEVEGGIGNQRADRAEADHAEGLALQLGAREGGLALLHHLGDLVPAVGDGAHPVDRADHVARGHDEGGDLLLLDGLGIRAGAVEDDDAALRALLDGDVVEARARSGDGKEVFTEFHAVQVCAADQHAVGVFHVRPDHAPALFQRPGAVLGNGVHGLYFKHF